MKRHGALARVALPREGASAMRGRQTGRLARLGLETCWSGCLKDPESDWVARCRERERSGGLGGRWEKGVHKSTTRRRGK